MSVTTKPPTTVPATVPASNVMPFPTSWGGNPALAGCCPPSGLGGLMQCYCDVQQAQAFICAMMINCIQTNPAVTQAIIAAIEASGSSLPLIGVTNGTDAQPGQVGEFFAPFTSLPYPIAPSTQNATVGVLQPGDWDCWAWANYTTAITGGQFQLSPQPAGFSNGLFAVIENTTTTGVEGIALVSPTARALISVPTLVNFSMTTNFPGNGPSAGTQYLYFNARRRR